MQRAATPPAGRRAALATAAVVVAIAGLLTAATYFVLPGLVYRPHAGAPSSASPGRPGPRPGEAGPLLAYYAAVAGLGAAGTWLLGREGDRLAFGPAPGVMALGGAIVAGSGVVVTLVAPAHVAALGLPEAAGRLLVYGALANFPAGWLLAGAGLRPRGEALRGLVLAAAYYVLAGLAWPVALGAAVGDTVAGSLAQFQDIPASLPVVILLWPAHVATAAGSLAAWLA